MTRGLAQADCLFCKVVSGEVPADIVRDSARTLAFRDINPQAPTHVLVIPKDHHPSVNELAMADPELLAEVLREAHEVAVADGIAETGYRVVFNTGPQAGQTVFHVHAHLLGGRGLGWPPG
ncbi:MAG: histidine triad family protein [Streptosporangiaceae bacterium]|jgi:histidine triad (HIT) family protein|nr:histidine triad protein [Streptosporangiaceae bacterium]MDX6428361.1 histidine triad family protein [Streptosporangiaceae bacterium]